MAPVISSHRYHSDEDDCVRMGEDDSTLYLAEVMEGVVTHLPRLWRQLVTSGAHTGYTATPLQTGEAVLLAVKTRLRVQ